MRLVLDVENTFKRKTFEVEGKKKVKTDMLPYTGQNELVSVGIKNVDTKEVLYKFFYHKELGNSGFDKKIRDYNETQECLSRATLIIGHNLKHDLSWAKASSFELPQEVTYWDTSIAEYVLAKGKFVKVSLKTLAEKHDLPRKKTDLTQEYLDQDIGFESMPIAIVEEYGRGDLDTTEALYFNQLERLAKPENWGLLPTIEMMNEFMAVLSEWQSNGIKIDLVELERVRQEYLVEKHQLEFLLNKLGKEVMGDTPFSITSGEDKSVLLYSRRVRDKNSWASAFNIGLDKRGKKLRRTKLSPGEFVKKVKELTDVEYRTEVKQCEPCLGVGYYTPALKNGLPGKARRICKTCNKAGVVYQATSRVAGFKFVPSNARDVGVNGFVTDADKLEYLISQTKSDKAKQFLSGLIRLNQVNTYLNTFVEGIKRAVDTNSNLLYTNFNQVVTATGRLSSSDPNFQNIPRGKTFPVKKAIISRFPGGKIMEFDYAQLEFRCAGALSGDKQIYEDIKNKVDIHAFTRDTLNAADGGNRDRQESKSETFKPVYGGTYGSPVQMAYYKAFKLKYKGLTKWQEETANYVLRNGYYKLPTGRQYQWHGVQREFDGRVSFFTQIVNYPVQGFATGDIVPIACILVQKGIDKQGLKSVPFLTVHDSVAADVYPGEEEAMRRIFVDSMLGVKQELLRRYDYNLTIPLEVEGKLGNNWLELEKFCTESHKVINPNDIIEDSIDDLWRD